MSKQKRTCIYKQISRTEAGRLINSADIDDDKYSELVEKIMSCRGPIPPNHEIRDSQFFQSFEQLLDTAEQEYFRNVESISGAIRGYREGAVTEGDVYTKEMEKEDTDDLMESYNKQFARQLRVAETHRNDLLNYARAAVMEYSKYGSEFEII